jgi:hypothetical protein
MEALIWIGAALALAGVGALVWCIRMALSVSKSGLPDEEMRAKLQKLVTLNLGAVGVSSLGLMLVVAGIVLG